MNSRPTYSPITPIEIAVARKNSAMFAAVGAMSSSEQEAQQAQQPQQQPPQPTARRSELGSAMQQLRTITGG